MVAQWLFHMTALPSHVHSLPAPVTSHRNFFRPSWGLKQEQLREMTTSPSPVIGHWDGGSEVDLVAAAFLCEHPAQEMPSSLQIASLHLCPLFWCKWRMAGFLLLCCTEECCMYLIKFVQKLQFLFGDLKVCSSLATNRKCSCFSFQVFFCFFVILIAKGDSLKTSDSS